MLIEGQCLMFIMLIAGLITGKCHFISVHQDPSTDSEWRDKASPFG
jgi:hypothetical protein